MLIRKVTIAFFILQVLFHLSWTKRDGMGGNQLDEIGPFQVILIEPRNPEDHLVHRTRALNGKNERTAGSRTSDETSNASKQLELF